MLLEQENTSLNHLLQSSIISKNTNNQTYTHDLQTNVGSGSSCLAQLPMMLPPLHDCAIAPSRWELFWCATLAPCDPKFAKASPRKSTLLLFSGIRTLLPNLG